MVKYLLHWLKILFPGVLVAALLISGPGAAAAVPNCGSWTVSSSPSVGSGNNQLLGVVALAASNAWAVGNSNNGTVDQTLAEQWNGTSWNVVTTPDVGTGNNDLTAVSALSPKNIWAVGRSTNASGIDQTLAEQWNGTSWSVVTTPNVGAGNNDLLGVAAVAANSVWAVGRETNSGGTDRTLIEHYNGTSWSVISSPNGSSGTNDLIGMTAVSANNIWAVGTQVNFLGQYHTLVEHFNGTSWKVVGSPNTGIVDGFGGITAIAANDMWAVGLSAGINTITKTLIAHFNGSKWSIVGSPNVGSSNNLLGGVSGSSSTNVWAVGYWTNGSVTQTLIEQWNGSNWSVVSSPNVGSGNNAVLGITHLRNTTSFWTVGYSNSGASNQTLVETIC